MSSSYMSTASRAPYLAGIFDSGLSVQIAPNGPKGWRARISKTSKDPALAVSLYEKSKAGTIFHTSRGTRWSIESQSEIRNFLQTIEPFVEVRKYELDLLLKFCSLSSGQSPEANELVNQWREMKLEDVV